MTELSAFLLLLAGFAALALSMPKHQRELFGRAPVKPARLILRFFGWSLLLLALMPAIACSGVGIGIVLWFGFATLAAMIVSLMLTYRKLWWPA